MSYWKLDFVCRITSIADCTTGHLKEMIAMTIANSTIVECTVEQIYVCHLCESAAILNRYSFNSMTDCRQFVQTLILEIARFCTFKILSQYVPSNLQKVQPAIGFPQHSNHFESRIPTPPTYPRVISFLSIHIAKYPSQPTVSRLSYLRVLVEGKCHDHLLKTGVPVRCTLLMIFCVLWKV